MGGRELVFSADAVYHDGFVTGTAAGIVTGEDKLSRLINLLLRKNQLDEIQKATTDPQAREELYKNYSIV